MKDFEVHLSLHGVTRKIGHARSNRTRGKETVLFEYADEWLRDADSFELEPDLPEWPALSSTTAFSKPSLCPERG